MKQRIPLDIIVAVLAGASCLLTLPWLGIPVWNVFIGWAWYYALGATPQAFKQIFPAIIPGAVLAYLCFILANYFSPFMDPMVALIVSVIIVVILLMLVLKVPLCSNSLVAFNAFSCVFATYYGGFYPQSGDFYTDTFMALVWSLIASFLGPLFGWLSIYLTFPQAEKKSDKTAM